jgi:CRISPR-associated protein Cmr4
MVDLRVGYLYSFAPIHCGGEGDLGNILEIAREVHTDFPYVPGSSFRGTVRDEVQNIDKDSADILFGKELEKDEQMGVHQVWFGDARLLWVPMRTMSRQGGSGVFSWVSCHSLIRDHAILNKKIYVDFPDHPVGTIPGNYNVADARLKVAGLNDEQKEAIALNNWQDTLKKSVEPTWNKNRIVLSDADFQVLMEHCLWTQIRNKISEESDETKQAGSAEVFWTDVCIPRDTILYYTWGYKLLKENPVTEKEHDLLKEVITGLLQVGGQANVGRGWVQSWVTSDKAPERKK